MKNQPKKKLNELFFRGGRVLTKTKHKLTCTCINCVFTGILFVRFKNLAKKETFCLLLPLFKLDGTSKIKHIR
jgi:hypothetical protein